jgi:DNA-binding MarR family transcriptional regulator
MAVPPPTHPDADADPLLNPQRVTDLLLYRLSVVTRSTSLPLVRIFEGELGITRRHWHLLALLVENGATAPSKLAAMTGLDRPRISRAVAGLVERGLIERRATDRRPRLETTAAGRALYDTAMRRVRAINTALAATLDADERRAFDGMLARLQERARTLADEVARGAPAARRNRRTKG